ncbi:hypothetical protein Pcinc_038207 [Petrolisthes cinctipes]|uniref:Sulfotransferase domain-containing protein n=1 Tax=Petrolisthes cinctipes TaxID=88211 RepID=A0AAE1BSG5_PETCI|nr:hypothetical protein Pcinc_038207 [Petrolisthes cinctipes]
MLVGLRKKHILLASVSLTGFLLLLVFTARPLQPLYIGAGGERIGFLRRRIANDNSIPGTGSESDHQPQHPAFRHLHPPSHINRRTENNPLVGDNNDGAGIEVQFKLTEEEKQSLVKQGILLVEQTQGIANGQQQQPKEQKQQIQAVGPGEKTDAEKGLEQQQQQLSQHEQWLQQVHLQHHNFLRQQHRLQEHYKKDTDKLSQQLHVPNVGNSVLNNGPSGGLAVARRTSPITYQSLRKQGLDIVSRTIQREYSNTERDLDFTPGKEVNPSNVRRVLVLSTWRSGSTYLGDLLLAYPGTYYSFEPLHHMLKNHHLEEGPLVDLAQQLLHGIYTCNYTHLDEYINYVRNKTFLMSHNMRLWNSCARNRAFCFDKEYLSRGCRMMPVNVVKTVRMGLNPVVSLLQDDALDLRVLHLIRDPRGCLHSRLKLSWCHADVCRDPGTVCRDLLTDLMLSDWVKENYPKRYLRVRYEDLGLKPEEKAQEIYRFLGLSYNKHVSNFVRIHTNPNRLNKKAKDAYSTYRDSKATIFAWRGDLEYNTVREIQGACLEPLQRLKLRIFDTEEDYNNTTIPVLLGV